MDSMKVKKIFLDKETPLVLLAIPLPVLYSYGNVGDSFALEMVILVKDIPVIINIVISV